MKGTEERLVSYMEGSKKRFVIPVYQRNYDWKIEHCKQLFDDLVKVVKHDRKSHFFGSIVSVYNPDGHQDEFLIIDGQQRLTTITLLFLAMYNLIQAEDVVPKSPHLGQQLYEDYLVDKYQPKETRIKLKPIKNDQMAFGKLFDIADDHISDSNLTINYQYFYDRIQRGEIEIDEIFNAVYKLEIINIKLNQDDNPQLIFESLNSTGLDLSEGDKIRNYILMGLTSKDQENFYDKYWSKIEFCTVYDVSSFVRDYLSVKQQSTPAINKVYFKFKEYVEISNFESIELLLIDLLDYAKKYEYLLKANSPMPDVNASLYRLDRIKTTVSRPFLMEVLRMYESDNLTEKELYEILLIVETYVFRRNICEIPTNALNKIFLMLHREIIRLDGTENEYYEKFKFVLLNKKDSGRFPDDEEFTEAFTLKNVYGMRGESKFYLFERLENAGIKETKDVWNHLDNGDYSIEHIMPQHLTPAWVTTLGDDHERIHEDWLHRLANLTLTAYNSNYSNYPFSDKRDMDKGFKQSGLRMNQWIGHQEKWDLAELEKRNELLMGQAKKIWPYVEANYQPPQKILDTVTLDDEINFTGETISKFSLMGAEQTVKSWTDMYQQVLIQLHSMDKSILTRLATTKDPSVELSAHFETSASSFSTFSKMIDNNIYVWTGTDTQYKINVLRKVFALFNIEPTELVFYLSEKENDFLERHLIRRRYWSYALPLLRETTGTFMNVSPSKDNWLNGYIGLKGLHIACIANFDSARVELYIGMFEKKQNKELFDYLYSHKDSIENAVNESFIWERYDDVKASKISLSLPDVSISNEEDWPKMARFHAEGCKTLLEAFRDIMVEYFAQ